MTALPLRDFTAAEQAHLAAIEAAPAEPESVRERVMDALAVELESLGIDGQMSAHACEYLADAALAVLRGPSSDAEQAVERVLDEAAMTDEEADAADVCAENYRRMGCDADYARCASLADQARAIADHIRDAVRGD